MRLIASPLALASICLLLAAPHAAGAADLPRSARIVYDVLYGGAEVRIGRAEQRWQLEGGRYAVQTELRPVIGPRIRYASEGELRRNAFVPMRFAEYRNADNEPRSKAEFDWSASLVRYGDRDSPHSAPLERGAQDVNALPYALAWLEPKAATPVIQVFSGRGQTRQAFAPAPPSSMTLNGQRVELQGWRAADGTHRTEVWVAPSVGNLPLRVRRVDDDRELQFVAREVSVQR